MVPTTPSPAQMASSPPASQMPNQAGGGPFTIPYGFLQPPLLPPQSDLLARALPGVQSAQRAAQLPASGGLTSSLAPPSIKRVDKEDSESWHNTRAFLANAFTLFVFALFAAPTIMSIQMGMDADAVFWIGHTGLWAIAVPIFLLGQHFYQLWMLEHRNRRRRYIFVIVPVVPAVLFMIIGGTYMSVGRHVYDQLKSDDCDSSGSLPAKFWMQDAYEEAHSAYGQCIVRLQGENNGVPLQHHPNLQSCTEWDELLIGQKDVIPWKGYRVSPGTLRQQHSSNDYRWQYLATTELNHLCGGFCKQGPPLFASYDLTGRMGGSCSQFVAFRFLFIMHSGMVVFCVGTMILITSIATYLYSRVALTNAGYKSGVTIA